MNTLTQEEKVVLQLVNNGINGCNKELNFENCDYSKVFKIIDLHSVNMIAFEGTKGIIDKLPNAIYTKWMYQASRKLSKRECIIDVQKRLTEILEKNNIKYFVFKGLCSSSYYNKPELRECGDVDFLVDINDFDKCDELLINSGFNAKQKKDIKHWNYVYDGIEVEMHHQFWEMPNTNSADFIKGVLDNAINNVKVYQYENYNFYGPGVVEHSLILILHIINHIQKGGIGLRHICDFAVFMSSDDFKNNYNDIINIYKSGSILKIASIIGSISNKYLGSPYYDFLKDVDESLVEGFLNDVMKSGNFGILSKDIYQSSDLFTLNGTENNFFKKITTFLKRHWKLCEKHRFLLPIAPFYIVFRSIFNMIRGKRPKVNVLKFTKSGLIRSKLYKNLEIFKDNDDE